MRLNAFLTSGVGRKMAWILDWYDNIKNTDICIFNGYTVTRGPRLPKFRGFLNFEASRLHSDTPHSVGLIWVSDRPVAETST